MPKSTDRSEAPILAAMATLFLSLPLIAAAAAAPIGPSAAAEPAEPASRSEDKGAKPERPRLDPVSDFVENALPGMSRMTLESARGLAKVIREDVKTYPSDWVPDEQVEMHTVVLDGLSLTFAVHRGRSSFLVSATFTKATWRLQHDLGVGAPEARVLKAFGQGSREGNVVMFTNAEGAPNAAEFTFERGVVAKVTLTPYTG